MKRVIGATKSYDYHKYRIYDNGVFWQVYDGTELIADKCETCQEAEAFVDNLNNKAESQQSTPTMKTVKSPKSCVYRKIAEGRVDLSNLQTVYVLQYGQNYYSSRGYVRYKDASMVVFLSKSAAEYVRSRTETNYTVTAIKLTARHQLP